MAAKLLRSAEDEERGLSDWLNHRFDNLQSAYGRALGGTLRESGESIVSGIFM